MALITSLKLGNHDSARDWGFAADYVRTMWLMLQAASPSDYVIATDKSHTVREFCEIAFVRVGLDYRDFVYSDGKCKIPAESVFHWLGIP